MGAGIKTFLIILTLMVLASGFVSLFFYFGGMEHYPRFFPVIPLFYTINSIPICLLINDIQNKRIGMPTLKKLSLLRLTKIVGSICLLLIGIILDKANMISYSIVFALCYIIYTIFETRILMTFSKQKD